SVSIRGWHFVTYVSLPRRQEAQYRDLSFYRNPFLQKKTHPHKKHTKSLFLSILTFRKGLFLFRFINIVEIFTFL
ncbi:hypothetical protein BZJ21_09460, partial [Salinivibrio costicola subsp. alcaliphilus]